MRRSVIPLFDVILTGEYVYLLISVIQGHLQDKKCSKFAVCEHYPFLAFKMNAVTKSSKIMFNIYRGLRVYRILMIVVELITKIIEFDTNIFQKCVF